MMEPGLTELASTHGSAVGDRHPLHEGTDMDHTTTSGSFDTSRDLMEPHTDPYRGALEALNRLHGILDPEKLPAEAADALKQVLGPIAGVVIVRNDAREVRYQVGDRGVESFSTPHGHAIIAKAMESGHPVVDGQGSDKTLAVPMTWNNHQVGAFVVEVADLEKRFGNTYVDLARLLGRHFALAFRNAFQARELAERNVLEGEDALSPGLSLRESKQRFERRLVRQRLKDSKGNIAAAARSLDMDRGQLSRLLKKHGIDKLDYKGSDRVTPINPPQAEMVRPNPATETGGLAGQMGV